MVAQSDGRGQVLSMVFGLAAAAIAGGDIRSPITDAAEERWSTKEFEKSEWAAALDKTQTAGPGKDPPPISNCEECRLISDT